MLHVLTEYYGYIMAVEDIFKYKSALKQGMDLLVQIIIPSVWEEFKDIWEHRIFRSINVQ